MAAIVGRRPSGATEQLERRIADEVRGHRERLGWSLGELAERSGVSKAMIHRIEQGEANPTAVLLGRLCAGLGITLSALVAAAESADVAVWRAGEQPVLHDDRMERTTVAATLATGGVDITRVCLDPGADIVYDAAPNPSFHQYLLVERGELEFTVGAEVVRLGTGDCVGALLDRPTRFRTVGDEPVRYLVVAGRPS